MLVIVTAGSVDVEVMVEMIVCAGNWVVMTCVGPGAVVVVTIMEAYIRLASRDLIGSMGVRAENPRNIRGASKRMEFMQLHHLPIS